MLAECVANSREPERAIVIWSRVGPCVTRSMCGSAKSLWSDCARSTSGEIEMERVGGWSERLQKERDMNDASQRHESTRTYVSISMNIRIVAHSDTL